MKAPAFAYARATSVDGALEMLALHGEKAKLLSGGQSLLPAMNLRLISPEIVIDISDLAELQGIEVRGGVLCIGALTRHAELLASPQIGTFAPLLAEAVRHVAHPAVRNRGTIGGSLAHADPAAELPACMVALDATIVARGQNGERRIAAADFSRAADCVPALGLFFPRSCPPTWGLCARRRGRSCHSEWAGAFRPPHDVLRGCGQAGLGKGSKQARQRRGGAGIDLRCSGGIW